MSRKKDVTKIPKRWFLSIVKSYMIIWFRVLFVWCPVQSFGCSNSYFSSLIYPGCHSVTSRGISQNWRCVTWRLTRCRVTRGTAGRCPWTRVAGWEAALLGAAETTLVGLNLPDVLMFLVLLIANCRTINCLFICQTHSGPTPSIVWNCMRRTTTRRADRGPALSSWLWCRRAEGCSVSRGPDSSPLVFPSTRCHRVMKWPLFRKGRCYNLICSLFSAQVPQEVWPSWRGMFTWCSQLDEC